MRFNQFTLYKTNLDPNYQNVIDGGVNVSFTNSTFKSMVFDSYYYPNIIYDGAYKSFKEDNGDALVSIAVRYEDVMDYNYAIIRNQNGYYYYFVLSKESLNDGSNPSTLFTLQRDAWSNNISYFSNHNEKDRNNIVRSHYDRYYSSGSSVRCLYYNSDDYSTIDKKTDITYSNRPGGNVIWVGFRLSGDTGMLIDGTYNAETREYSNLKVVRIGDGFSSRYDEEQHKWVPTSDTAMTFGGNLFDSVSPVFYTPLCSFVVDNNGNITYNFHLYLVDENNKSFTLTSNFSLIKKRLDFTASNFQEVFCTIYPPFNYTMTENGLKFDATLSNYPLMLHSDDSNLLQDWSNNPIYNLEQDCPYVISTQTQPNAKISVSGEYVSPVDYINPESSLGKILFDSNSTYEQVKYYEPRIYCNPYYNTIVSIGDVNQEIPISFDETKYRYDILYGCKTNANVRIYGGNDLILPETSLKNMGGLPTSSDKWEGQKLISYMNILSSFGLSESLMSMGTSPYVQTTVRNKSSNRSNQYKDRNNAKNRLMISQSLQSSESSQETSQTSYTRSSKNVGGIIASGGMGVISETARLAQISATPVASNQPSSIATDNITNIVPKIVTSRWIDNREVDDICGDMFLYGYRYGSVRSVKYQCRLWFDYCQTDDCSLPDIKNYNDRFEIENAFNAGITKWHYQEGFGLNADFDRTKNNVEKKFVSAEDAQLSYDFTSSTPFDNKGVLGNTSDYRLTHSNVQTDNEGVYQSNNKGRMDVPVSPFYNGNTNVFAFKLSSICQNEGVVMSFGDSLRVITNMFRIADSQKVLRAYQAPFQSYTDALNKTITIISDGLNGGYENRKLAIYVDGVQILKGEGYNGPNRRDLTFFTTNNQLYSGLKIAKFKMWIDSPGKFEDYANVDWVKNHLI